MNCYMLDIGINDFDFLYSYGLKEPFIMIDKIVYTMSTGYESSDSGIQRIMELIWNKPGGPINRISWIENEPQPAFFRTIGKNLSRPVQIMGFVK